RLAQVVGEELQARGIRHLWALLGAYCAVALPPARLGVVLDHLAQLQHAVHQRLWPRRAAGHVDVDRHELVGWHERIVVEDAHGAAASAHRDSPLGLEHLVVEAADDRSHLDRDPPREDDQIGLTRRGAECLVAESCDVHARAGGLELLHRATGQPEGKREEGVRPRPRDRRVEGGEDEALVHIALELLALEMGGLVGAFELASAQELVCVRGAHAQRLWIAPRPRRASRAEDFALHLHSSAPLRQTYPNATNRRTMNTIVSVS